MSYIKDIPTLKGDNYDEWWKKIDLAFICGEVYPTIGRNSYVPLNLRRQCVGRMLLHGKPERGTKLP